MGCSCNTGFPPLSPRLWPPNDVWLDTSRSERPPPSVAKRWSLNWLPWIASRPLSTAPEAIVARHMGLEVLGISCITNAAAGVFPEPLHHSEVMETAQQVKGQLIALLEGIIGRL
mgnify:CR=1 FL=1